MMEFAASFGRRTFSSLSVRNYRLYFMGQGISHCGNWMQTVGLGWLVLQLTGSGTALGTVLAFRFLPMFLLGAFAGTVVGRFEKRRILYVTQSSAALLALLLSMFVFTGIIEVWMLFIFALLFGLTDVIDSPTRQTFVHEMVGPDNLHNAVALNSTEANVARAIGPLVAAALIAGVGIAFCFFANAISFLAVIFILTRIRPEELHREPHVLKRDTHVLAGLRYAASMPVIRNILLSMAVIGTLSYEFQVSLPLFARLTFGTDASGYAGLLSAMGAGSVLGGLFAASRTRVALSEFVASAVFFGCAICLTALSPSLPLALAAMVFVGFFSISLTSAGNTLIQLESAAHMRGGVMSLWSMALFGSTLIGAPVIGFVGEHMGARWALAVGGVAALLGGLYAALKLLGEDRWRFIPAMVKMATFAADVEEEKK